MVYNCNGSRAAGGGLSSSPVLAHLGKENRLELRPVGLGRQRQEEEEEEQQQQQRSRPGRADVLHDVHFCPPPCRSKRVPAATSTSPYLEAVGARTGAPRRHRSQAPNVML